MSPESDDGVLCTFWRCLSSAFTYTLALHVYGVLTDRDWVRGLLLLDTFTSIKSYIRYLYIYDQKRQALCKMRESGFLYLSPLHVPVTYFVAHVPSSSMSR